MRTLSTISNNLAVMEESLKEDEFPVDGFAFIEDGSQSDSEPLLPIEQGMPRVEGFNYHFALKVYGDVDA